MADVVDTANEKADILLQARVETQRHAQAKARLEPVGRCHWCEDLVGDAELFCSPECRDDHDKAARARARNGSSE